ncbi:MAG: DUF4405 domain-containing protein [Rhodobacteraceae bacterium]|jgi:hypothetical protein|nr:DUF4405 domain-containing protein [Paracoccaceae bacterium]
MSRLLSRYATPLTTGLFLVSLISGIALFLHIGPPGFHGMHEWLSLLLILPFVLHLWRNWRPMSAYLRHLPMALSLALATAAAGLFLLPGQGGGSGGPPVMQLGQKVLQATPAELAAALDTTPEALVAGLRAGGFAAAAADLSLADTARAAGTDDNVVIAALLAPAG